ncbi:MAG: hypothetical protein HZB59_07135 [Ignavibacteriales bacterium]|nr:hypothetical protein [Ignavibacteriales bacterium]
MKNVLKRLYSIFVFLILSYPALHSQESQGWIWQNPFPQGNDLYDVVTIDARTVYAVGDAGMLLSSTNSGSTWSVRGNLEDIRTSFRSLQFNTQSNGWIVGEEGRILNTTNQGDRWRVSYIGTSNTLKDVFFFDRNLGWISGQNGYLIRTTNNGSSWERLGLNLTNSLNSIQFVSPQVGFLAADRRTLYTTMNSGNDWQLSDTLASISPSDFVDLKFINQSLGWVLGRDFGEIFITSDGGSHWSKKSTGTGGLNALDFFSQQVGVIVGNNGVILRSATGGSTWNAGVFDSTSDFLNVSVLSSPNSIGWAVGTNGRIWKTTNNGVNWVNYSGGDVNDLRELAVIDSNRAFASGANGVIAFTRNGGARWDTVHTNYKTVLNSIDFLDELTGVTVGDSGIILYTLDRGLTWTKLTSPVTSRLMKIRLNSSLVGIIVGEGGVILRSRNGGLDWNLIQLHSNYRLADVQFIDKDTIIAVGDSSGLGRMFKSTDAGVTWVVPHAEPYMALLSVQFISPQSGFASGRNGTILTTTDYGTTWYPRRINTPSLKVDYQSIFFVDDSTGWIAGKQGTVLKSTNGGKNWFALASGTNRDLYSAKFISDKVGWVIGDRGAILKTVDGGGRVLNTDPIVAKAPKEIKLLPNFPNPYYPMNHSAGTYLPFELNISTSVMIKIYDILGRKVQEIPLGFVAAGVYDNSRGNPYAPSWDGRDMNGVSVPTGVYIYSLSTPKTQVAGKLVLIR